MNVLFEKLDHVGMITMNRPASLNALNSAMLNELYDVLCRIESDNDVRVVVITGSGKSFVAGADIAEMSELGCEEARNFCRLGHRTFSKIDGMKKPFIAAINGYAFGGGCELALACDIRIAGERAMFSQPEVSLGITPGFGGTQRLPRVIGVANAMDLILTGRTVKASEAKSLGLVNYVYPQDELIAKTMELANTIANNAPVAVYEAKQAIRCFTDTSLLANLEYEEEAFGRCFMTSDQKMAMKAFITKTKRDEFKGE